VFSVTDNGVGINEIEFPKLFKMFCVLQRKDKLAERGNGVGLAIAKRGIEVHHGRMWVESEVDVGTTFYFSIPEKT
jgi:light-regulated signal transduction histidine kinase (bacteriophytochrome)